MGQWRDLEDNDSAMRSLAAVVSLNPSKTPLVHAFYDKEMIAETCIANTECSDLSKHLSLA